LSSTSPPAILAHGLCRRYGQRWALARLDLELAHGEKLLLIGANGSGKTTLLRVLATLLTPSAGRVQILGLDPARDPGGVRARLGLLTHSLGLYEDLSGLDNLRAMARLSGRDPGRAVGLLNRVGLDPRRPDAVRGYSAGMRKRLQFAHILLREPELTLVDEPFAALDPNGIAGLGALLAELPGTVVVASHQIRRASAFCTRGLLLDQGLPRWQGPAREAWSAWTALHGDLEAVAEGA
jgi:heme exporter protein A